MRGTREQRDAAESLLCSSYLRLRQPSGEVEVARVGFSADPRNWFIRASSHVGKRYPGRKGNKRMFRTDVLLEAVLSPVWLDPTEESDCLVPLGASSLPFSNGFLLAGTEPIAPPPGIDRAEILHRTFFEEGGLALNSAMVFRFSRGPVTETVGNGTRHRRGLAKETRLCAAVFHILVAGHMRDRMNLTPGRRTA
jgi:hypothetical protein